MAAIGVLCVAAILVFVSGAVAASGAAPGTFQGNAGAFSVGFKVSPSGKQITGLRTDFQATEDTAAPE